MIPDINSDSSLGLLYVGSSFRLQAVLKRDGIRRDLTGKTLTACLAKPSDSTVVGTAVTLDPTATGADYGQGVVVVSFPPETTIKAAPGDLRLYIYEWDGTDPWAYLSDLRATVVPVPPTPVVTP